MAGFYANKSVNKIAVVNPKLAGKINDQGCCLTEADVPEVQKIDRMMLVLVRCGMGRFLCPVQDVAHFIGIIEDHAKLAGKPQKGACEPDHIRDVSFPYDVS